jgi:ribonuclease HI
MNWDAAADIKQGRVGLGCIARTSTGAVLAARSLTKVIRVDPAMAEALAALYAIVFGLEMGYNRVICEGDAQKIIQDVNEEGPCTSRYGNVIEGIKSEMRKFEYVCFSHVVREANSAAHQLAKMATAHVIDQSWLAPVPPDVDVYGIVRREEYIPPL